MGLNIMLCYCIFSLHWLKDYQLDANQTNSSKVRFGLKVYYCIANSSSSSSSSSSSVNYNWPSPIGPIQPSSIMIGQWNQAKNLRKLNKCKSTKAIKLR